MLGTTPGDLIPYFDFNRFAELLTDKGESAATTVQTLNSSVRALAVLGAAENDVVEACRTKQNYTLQQLKDLVRDYQIKGGAGMGFRLVSLLADLTWNHAIERKRYAEGTPQGDDKGAKKGQELLELIKSGSRIFILEGVQQTDGSGNVIGVYGGQDKPNAGLLSGSTMHSDVGRPTHLWGQHHHIPWAGPWCGEDW